MSQACGITFVKQNVKLKIPKKTKNNQKYENSKTAKNGIT